MFFFMLTACQTASYGKIKQSRDVEKMFASGQVLSDHNYYYSGSNVRPDAVMGIHQNDTLDNEFWTTFNDPRSEFKFWFNGTYNSLSSFAYHILAPDGKQIGIYYSRWNTGMIKMGENNQVRRPLIKMPIHSECAGVDDCSADSNC